MSEKLIEASELETDDLLSESARRDRRNALLLSLLGCVYTVFDLETKSILGGIEVGNPHYIPDLLIILSFYFLVMFYLKVRDRVVTTTVKVSVPDPKNSIFVAIDTVIPNDSIRENSAYVSAPLSYLLNARNRVREVPVTGEPTPVSWTQVYDKTKFRTDRYESEERTVVIRFEQVVNQGNRFMTISKYAEQNSTFNQGLRESLRRRLFTTVMFLEILLPLLFPFIGLLVFHGL